MGTIEELERGRVFEDQVLEGIEASELDLSGKDFVRCTFRKVKLPESLWKGAHLEDCTFEDCDLTRMHPASLALSGVDFRGCKLLGVDWAGVGRNPQVTFEDCDLRYASFVALGLRRTPFLRCKAREANFIDTDLTEADFEGSDLTGCVFNRATLAKTRLAGAQGVFLDPARNRVRDAQVSVECAVLLALSFGLQVEGYEDVK